MTTLADFGERRIIREVLPRFVAAPGDDCAVVTINAVQVIVTTDPVPEPAATTLGGSSDTYWKGWLLVTINASDLAASAASPAAFLAAIEAPADLPLDHLERLLSGILDACNENELKYIGGNMREAARLTGTGTAIGFCVGRSPLTRAGAKPGYVVASVGQGGVFWRDAFRLRADEQLDSSASPIFRPRAHIRAMAALAEQRLVHSAMDNSDGLLPTLSELARRSQVDIIVDLARLIVPQADHAIVDQARLWLGWGDWNVIVTMPRSALAGATEIARQHSTPLIQIGECVTGSGRVQLTRAGKVEDAPRLESERFAADSWFSSGIDSYVDRLMSVRLP